MNYIHHLTSFYSAAYTDDRLSPYHISLYSGIFQLWNATHFPDTIQVNRAELMKLSKIGSVNTYIRCLKELQDWHYIEYFPSRNVIIGSKIRVIRFDKTTDNTTETPLRHFNKPIKTYINTPSIEEVIEYFKQENYPEAEATLFFSHYTANGWMMGASPVKNWQSAAINWMVKAESFNPKKAPSALSSTKTKKADNTINNTENYHEPL
jgi:hypothetical protein